MAIARNELMKARETALKMAIEASQANGYIDMRQVIPTAEALYEFLIMPILPEGITVAKNVTLSKV